MWRPRLANWLLATKQACSSRSSTRSRKSCVSNSLSLSRVMDQINTILFQAFCSISTGIYGYPIADATRVALETARDFAETEDGAKVCSTHPPVLKRIA